MGRDPDGKAKMINVDENGNVKVQQSGTIPEIWGSSIDDRPPASSVEVGQIFIVANEDLDMWVSNGISWVVI